MKLDRLDSYINDLAINAQQSKGCKKVAKKAWVITCIAISILTRFVLIAAHSIKNWFSKNKNVESSFVATHMDVIKGYMAVFTKADSHLHKNLSEAVDSFLGGKILSCTNQAEFYSD